MAFYRGPRIITDGLIMYLDAGNTKSYPGTGTSWYDISGNFKNGTLVNGAGYNSTNSGSIVFDGTNDYVQLPTLDTNSSFTIMFTVNRKTGSGSTTLSGIDASGYLQIKVQGYSIQLLRAYIATVGSAFTTTYNVDQIATFTITLDKLGQTYTCYKNGISVGSQVVDTTYITSSPVLGLNTSSSEPLTGNIYNFMFYNKVLTPTEVLQNYNATKTRFGL